MKMKLHCITQRQEW